MTGKYRHRRISFARYATWLGVLTIGFYLIFAVVSYLLYEDTRERLHQSELEAAHSELRSTLDKALAELRGRSEELTHWDELYQQLTNSQYFFYWYAHRIQNGETLGQQFDDLMLYNASGQALTKLVNMPLPSVVTKEDVGAHYRVVDGDIKIQFVYPLKRTERAPVLGYLGLEASLLPTVHRLHAFNLIDASSLAFNGDRLDDLEAIVGAARFSLYQNRHFSLMDSLVINVIIAMGVLVAIPSLFLIIFSTRFVGRSVRRVSTLIEQLREPGEPVGMSTATQELQIAELARAEQSLRDYHHDLSETHSVLDERNQELWRMAHRDALTGTSNRRAFDDYWATILSISDRQQQTLRLMLADVNRFKTINDSYGHVVGDTVLVAVANCLGRALRSNESLFRFGGDEFACVLQDCDDSAALEVARRCDREMQLYPFYDEMGIDEPVRLSIGISQLSNGHDPDVKELLRQADMAMYTAKRPGGSRVSLFEAAMANASSGVFSNSANEAVYRAIERGEGLRMHYQPIVDVESREPVYYEALVRLQHAGRLITPDEIFPVVESRQLELEMDRAILGQIENDLDDGLIPAGTGVSLNLSGPSLVNDRVLKWLQPFSRFSEQMKIVVEVTETSLITQLGAATRNIEAIRSAGFEVALDDFGSGYSSLQYLTSMPVDIVKFDSTLIRGLDSARQRQLVAHLVEVILESGQHLVAEGIETEQDLENARGVGFDLVQGYLLGRPEYKR